MATDLVFSKSERAQIALRFKTLYSIVTDKTWVAGAMGAEEVDEFGSARERYSQKDLRKMGKGGKSKPPAHLKMCLAGAAAYVNGPTEEEIVALLATQIMLDKMADDDGGEEEPRAQIIQWMDNQGDKYVALDRSNASIALVLFEQFALHPDGYGGSDLASYVYDMEGTAVSEIVHFNDNQDYAGPVRATIKRAQKLYDGLYRVWELEKRYSAVMAQRAKDFAKLKL